MDKAKERVAKLIIPKQVDDISELCKFYYINGYHQAEKDIKEELSNLFQYFMLDCINDDTETHILHFVDVFNNKIKTIGNGRCNKGLEKKH